MPTPTTTDLPIPNSWEEFEDICTDVLKRMWRDPYVVRHGRAGQRQDGVDVFGKPFHLRHEAQVIAAAQCKRVDTLSEAMVREEIDKASRFTPRPAEYLILTTALRDASLQKYVRTTPWQMLRVEILFWEDISLELSGHDDLLKKHFPRWFQGRVSQDDVILLLSASVPDDFDYSDGIGQYLHRQDVMFRIQEERREPPEPFDEPWVRVFPNPSAFKRDVHIEYGGVRIKSFTFIEVDGHRYSIPIPQSATELRISQFQYHLATILNRGAYGYMFDSALRQAGITVDL